MENTTNSKQGSFLVDSKGFSKWVAAESKVEETKNEEQPKKAPKGQAKLSMDVRQDLVKKYKRKECESLLIRKFFYT